VEEAESIICAVCVFICVRFLGRLKLVNNVITVDSDKRVHYMTNRHVLNTSTDVRTPVAVAPQRIRRNACSPNRQILKQLQSVSVACIVAMISTLVHLLIKLARF